MLSQLTISSNPIVSARMTSIGQFVTSKDGTRIWADHTGDFSKPAVVFVPGEFLLSESMLALIIYRCYKVSLA